MKFSITKYYPTWEPRVLEHTGTCSLSLFFLHFILFDSLAGRAVPVVWVPGASRCPVWLEMRDPRVSSRRWVQRRDKSGRADSQGFHSAWGGGRQNSMNGRVTWAFTWNLTWKSDPWMSIQLWSEREVWDQNQNKPFRIKNMRLTLQVQPLWI